MLLQNQVTLRKRVNSMSTRTLVIKFYNSPVDTWRRFNVYKSIYDVKTTSCVYWTARLKAYKTQSIHTSQKDNYDVIVIIMTPYSFSRYLNCCLHFLAMYKKDLVRKIKVNFKIYDVTTWETNSCGTHIDQYLKKERRSDNENWSVNRILHEKHFSWEIMHKMWWRNYPQTVL